MNTEAAVSAKWKSMLDLAAGISESPGAYVWLADARGGVFLLKSCGVAGMDDAADMLMADAAAYCGKVAVTRERLMVANSQKAGEWRQLPSGLSAFLGYPVMWEGRVFCVVCLIDRRGRKFSGRVQQLLGQYASIMQDDLTAQADRQRVRDSEARCHALFHLNDAVQLIVDGDTGLISDMNGAARRYYGVADGETRLLREIAASDDKPMAAVAEALEKGASHFASRHIRFDGRLRDVEVFGGRVSLGERRLLHMIVQDVTERKSIERGLIESENRFRLFMDNAPDGVFVEMDGVFVYVNRMALGLLGASHENELLGREIAAYFPGLPQCRALAREPRSMARLALCRPDRGHVEVELSAVLFRLGGEDGALVFMHDITSRRRLETEKLSMEAQLRHKQKLESIGVLAGGVAHEINNPVSGIINYAQLIAEAPGAGAEIVEFSGEIIKEGHRIAGIVRNLLKFARQEKQTHSLAQVNDIINETLLLIRTIIRNDHIRLTVALAAGLPGVKCRSQQIQQVLMNLITNARDALNARYQDGHEDKRILLSSAAFTHADGSEWVRVIVEDHGAGIPDDVKERMFDPFFTTKSRGEGTGLGLSISHGIVQDHHGHLYFETDGYTRAILELPVNNGWRRTGGLKE